MHVLKYAVVALISLMISLFLWEFFSSYIQRSRAATPAISLTLSPLELKLKPGETGDVAVSLKTDTSLHKISAMDLIFVSTGTLDITDISAPANAANGDHSIYNELLKQIGPRQAQISYISIKEDGLLPSEVSFVIRVKNSSTSGGSGLLQIDGASSKVTGNIAEHTYVWNKVDLSSCNNAVTPTGTQSLDHISLTMDPEVSSMSTGETKIVSVKLKTDAASHKISAFDLTFLATGGIAIQSVGKPVGNASSELYTALIQNIQGTSARISYVAVKPDAELPDTIEIPITIRNTGDAGILLLDRPPSQVAGNISYNTYVWDVTGTAVINWSSTPASPSPGAHTATVSMQPSSGELANASTKDVTVTLTTDSPDNKVSAFDFVFVTSGNLIITAVTLPDNAGIFMPLVSDVTSGRAHIVYTSLKDNTQLPSSIPLKVTVARKTDGTGSGALELDASSAKVTGTIPQNNYTISVQNNAQFFVNGIPPTSVPQSQSQSISNSPTSTPVQTSTIAASKSPTSIPQSTAKPIDPRIKWAVVLGNTALIAILIALSFL